jgi:hypothetical protein
MAGKVSVVGEDVVVEPKRPRRRRTADPERAPKDLSIPRPDLGRGATTFVAKGDRIPDAAREFLP